MSLTHIATKSMPIVSNFLSLFAISIFVPTPSVLDTNKGFFIPLGIFVIEAKLPIFLLLLPDFFFY